MIIAGLEFPDALDYLVEHQVWARREADETVTVGITALGIRLAGDIYMCRPKPVGSVVEQGRSIAVVELAKSIVSVKSPISGTVVAINPDLAAHPERVHTDPYGQGWLARVHPTRWSQERDTLVRGEAAVAPIEHHAWLYREGEGP